MKTISQPTSDKTYYTHRKAPDLMLRVKVTWIDGLQFVNIRDYVPSLAEDGKGVMFPVSMLPAIVESLIELERQIGTGVGSPGPGQGSLGLK